MSKDIDSCKGGSCRGVTRTSESGSHAGLDSGAGVTKAIGDSTTAACPDGPLAGCDLGSDTAQEAAVKAGVGGSAADRLMQLAMESEIFRDEEGGTWVLVARPTGRKDAVRIESGEFKKWLRNAYACRFSKSCSSQAIDEAVATCQAIATNSGAQRRVYIRVGTCGDDWYLDLADELGRAVKITPGQQWKIVDASDVPIPFHRPSTVGPLPEPVRGGSIRELLDVMNIDEQVGLPTVAAWLLSTFLPEGPFFVLTLTGEPGSGKSCTCRFIRSIVDPTPVGSPSLPSDPRELYIAARDSWVLAGENISKIPRNISDALCTICTGGSLCRRRLYSDADAYHLSVKRPVLLNGITNYATAPDLASRSLPVRLSRIKDKLSEKVLAERLTSIQPRVLGVLLDAFAAALARPRDLERPSDLTRMVEAYNVADAAEAAMGFSPGTMERVFTQTQVDTHLAALEDSALGLGIVTLVDQSPESSWDGTPTELLSILKRVLDVDEAKNLPHVNKVRGELRRLGPSLQCAHGISVVEDDKRTSKSRSRFHIRLDPQQEGLDQASRDAAAKPGDGPCDYVHEDSATRVESIDDDAHDALVPDPEAVIVL